jgi:hypothetical protein
VLGMMETLSNTPHVHLILNHVPTVGFGVALALFVAAEMRRNNDLQVTSLVLFFCVAVVSIATYLSGSAAAAVLLDADPPLADASIVRAHEDAALLAFVFMEITGFVAWLGLWHWRRVSHFSSRCTLTILTLAIVTFGLMARAAELGGGIHHPEILETAATTESTDASILPGTEDAGLTNVAEQFVREHIWVWPALETVHFVGLSMLFTVVLIVDLRLLGMIKSVSYAAVFQVLPIGMLGFGLNLITGMLFFITEPEQYVHNGTFYWKIIFIVLGGVNVVYFVLDEKLWRVGAGDDAPFIAKVAAASAMFIWAAVVFFGHMLPFLGNAF